MSTLSACIIRGASYRGACRILRLGNLKQESTLMDIVNEELELVRQAVLLSARDLEPNQCIQMFNACLDVRTWQSSHLPTHKQHHSVPLVMAFAIPP